MRRFWLIFVLFNCSRVSAQIKPVMIEKGAYKITENNLGGYFGDYSLVSKNNREIVFLSINCKADTLRLRFNNKGQIHWIELKSKDPNIITSFKDQLTGVYDIYPTDSMKLYFNTKSKISFNFYSLNDYKYIDLFLNDRLTLDEI